MTWDRISNDDAPQPNPTIFVRASMVGDPRGMRAMVGSQNFGWRGEFRADGPVTQEGRVYIPLLTEHDWYRAEAEQVEVFAPLIPVEKVWVEKIGDHGDVDPDGPGISLPTPAVEQNRIIGRRVIYASHQHESDYERDLRAISDGLDGHALVADEADWYRWSWSGKTARARRLPLQNIWLE